MHLIDTHCHLYASEFTDDLPSVLERSERAMVGQILLPNIDFDSIDPMLALCRSHPDLFRPMMGLHPCYVNDQSYSRLDEMYEWLLKGKSLIDSGFCAVGEIGIDLYWDKSTLMLQEKAFRKQIEWAITLDLPIVIHVRDSFPEVFAVLDELMQPGLRGVFHCFTGSQKDLEHILSYPDFYLGLGGVLTFKKSGLDLLAKNIPSNRYMFETDAPYLSPSPYRGKRNEPANLSIIAQKMAEILDLSLEIVMEQSSANARELFRL